jgi:hypothetical protein
MRKYTVLESGYIHYEENGISYTIPNDPANSDYQRYLNPDAEQSTPIVIDEAETK